MSASNKINLPDMSHLSPSVQKDFSTKLARVIDGFTVLPRLPRTILITGGYKFGELSMKNGEVMSDLDVYILSNWFPLYWRRLVHAQDRINDEHGFFFHYRGMFPLLLKHTQTYWGFRMREESIILRGDASTLATLCPNPSSIQTIESVRFMFSTLVLWIYNGQVKPFNMEQPHLVARVYLNLAEALVTHAGKLVPSYKERMNVFQSIASEYPFLNDTLRERMQVAYLSKVDADAFYKESTFDQVSFSQALDDCLFVIQSFLTQVLPSNSTETINTLTQQERTKPLFFAAYWWRLKRKGFQPSLSIIWNGSLTDLFSIALNYSDESLKDIAPLLKRYTGKTSLTKEELVLLFELITIPVIVQL